MNLPVSIVLLGWIPLVLGLFAVLPPRRAAILSFVGGALFLPVGGFPIPGLPDYSRATSTAMICLLAVFIFDGGRLMRFRPALLDVPMAVFCVVPLLSSLDNGLGAYDGLSGVVHHAIVWGTPYFIGRLYLDELAAHREMALTMLMGALIYVPLCLFEVRMSPQLHNMLYGYHPHQFAQHLRADGYRPMVFMEHGLAVGMWMGTCSLIGVWLWHTGAVRKVFNVPVMFAVPALLGTFVLCKTMGAVLIFACAAGALLAAKWLRVRAVVMALALVPLVYIGDRVTGSQLTRPAVELAALVSVDRAASLEMRFTNEEMLAAKGLQRPLFGWGGWGRSRVTDEYGNDISITDGLWVIFLGVNGVVGLAALLGWQVLPAVAVLRRVRPAALGSAEAAAPVALAVVLLMVAIDSLPNSPNNPVFTMVAGGLVSLAAALRRPAAAGYAARPAGVRVAGAPAME